MRVNMDEIKLLNFKIDRLEKNFLNIIKDIDERLNKIEDRHDLEDRLK
jgi:hypothetical protein